MEWIFLIIAGILEWGWPVGLKYAWSDKGFNLFPALVEEVLSGVENAQWAWGQSFVDLDLDGDLDLLVANGFFTGVEEGDT